jgi:hypothetical protein
MKEDTNYMQAFINMDYNYKYNLLLPNLELTLLNPFNYLPLINPTILYKPKIAIKAEISFIKCQELWVLSLIVNIRHRRSTPILRHSDQQSIYPAIGADSTSSTERLRRHLLPILV